MRCPNNGIRIRYELAIETTSVISVEAIIDKVESMSGYHESIADELLLAFGGRQTLIAHHHGVTIQTTRREPTSANYLDQNAGGMAGTPGY